MKTWIFGILHRVAANHRRTRKRKQDKWGPLEELAGEGPGPDVQAEAVEAARLVQRFCASLALGTVLVLVGLSLGAGFWLGRRPREHLDFLKEHAASVYAVRIRSACPLERRDAN